MSNALPSSTSATPVEITTFAGVAPLTAVVFLGFLAIGVPLPTLSLYVHGDLGFGTAVAGLVIGLQSLATIATRHRAGTLSDHRGPRLAVLLGLPVAASSGLFYLASAWLPLDPTWKLVLLIAGRLVLGLGESLFTTGTMAWGIARVGAPRMGKVMSWQGIAMYAAVGLGAPLGLAAQAAFGFAGVAFVTIAVPLLALGVAVSLPAISGDNGGGMERVPFHRVIGLIWRPGLIQALATVPFAAMAAFLPLDFARQGWPGAGLALAGFGTGYILVRLLFSHLPARHGALRVAAGSLIVQLLGQALIWIAPGPSAAVAGAVLTGLGFSLMFPTLGVMAAQRLPAAQRGRAVANFIGFFDLAIGTTGPVVGLLVAGFGSRAAFVAGAAACVLALGLLLAPRLSNPVQP